MYPFFLYHRLISYKYKFSKTETFILKRLALPFKGAITPEFNFRCGHPFTTAKVKYCIIEWKYLTVR